nr:hypothetical protein [Tanacetum cinerariifolium]
MLSSGEGVFIERGKSRVASRLTDFSESEEDLSSDHPEHEGAALDVRSAAKERRKGPCSGRSVRIYGQSIEYRKEPLGEVPGLGSPPFLSIFIYNIKRTESVLTLIAIYDAIRGE